MSDKVFCPSKRPIKYIKRLTFPDSDAVVDLLDDVERLLTELPLPADDLRRHLVHLVTGKAAVVAGEAVLDQAEEHVVRVENLVKC